MSENDSQRPQDVGHVGETQQQPRVQVESTPADGNIPYVQAYDTPQTPPCGPPTRRPESRWAANRS